MRRRKNQNRVSPVFLLAIFLLAIIILAICGFFILSFAGGIFYFILWKKYKFPLKTRDSFLNILMLATQTINLSLNYGLRQNDLMIITSLISFFWVAYNFYLWRIFRK